MRVDYFLPKRMWKVAGEYTLMCLGYNIKWAKNLLGYEKVLEQIAAGNC